jgi:hypothetical protein
MFQILLSATSQIVFQISEENIYPPRKSKITIGFPPVILSREVPDGSLVYPERDVNRGRKMTSKERILFQFYLPRRFEQWFKIDEIIP